MTEQIWVAVLGSGNGGLTFAGDLTLAGFPVTLFDLPRFEESLAPIREKGGIEMAGVCRTGFAKLNTITADIEEALEGAKVIIIAIPSAGHEEFAKVCAPHLKEGQIIVLNPGYTLGAVVFIHVLIDEGVDVDKLIVGDTASLLYATRKYLPNRVFCWGVKSKLPFAAFPATKTKEALDVLNKVYVQKDSQEGILYPVENVLMTGLVNSNPAYHVPMMILKAVDIELGEEPYSKCVHSPARNRMREAISREFLALQKALEFKPLSHSYVLNKLMYPPGSAIIEEVAVDPSRDSDKKPEWAKSEYQVGQYASNTGKNLLTMRYLTEDIPYAFVPLSDLGRMLNVPTPVIDACITIASTITRIDFRKEGRTARKLGINYFTKEELLHYVNVGRALPEQQ